MLNFREVSSAVTYSDDPGVDDHRRLPVGEEYDDTDGLR
jgi:hypothetical protein